MDEAKELKQFEALLRYIKGADDFETLKIRINELLVKIETAKESEVK